MQKPYMNFSFFFLLLLCTQLAIASTAMRCGTKLIYTGDSKVDVLLKCGEPMFKETVAVVTRSTEFANIDAQNALKLKSASRAGRISTESSLTEAIDEWTYNLGKGQFLRILRFRGSTLESITDGDRY